MTQAGPDVDHGIAVANSQDMRSSRGPEQPRDSHSEDGWVSLYRRYRRGFHHLIAPDRVLEALLCAIR